MCRGFVYVNGVGMEGTYSLRAVRTSDPNTCNIVPMMATHGCSDLLALNDGCAQSTATHDGS